MGSVCGCFEGLRAQRGRDAARSCETDQGPEAPKRLSVSLSRLAGASTPTKSERSPARGPRSGASQEVSPSAGCSTREPTEEAPSSRRSCRRSEGVGQALLSTPRSPRRSTRSGARGSAAAAPWPAELVGSWRYHETAAYTLSQIEVDHWRFDEVQDSGRSVVGHLRPQGSWMKAALHFMDTEEECGTIRMAFSRDEGIIRSNFRPAGADWWSGDMVAVQEKSGSKRRRPAPPEEEVLAVMESPRPGSPREQRSSPQERFGSAARERPGSTVLEPSSSAARERSGSTAQRASAKNEKRRSASKGGGQEEKSEKSTLERIPTRIKAKLERSMVQRRRTPSLTKEDRDSGSMEGAETEDRRGGSGGAGEAGVPDVHARISSRQSSDSDQSSSVTKHLKVMDHSNGGYSLGFVEVKDDEWPCADVMPKGLDMSKRPARPTTDRRPCCSQLFQACCRSGGPTAGAPQAELQVEQSTRW